MLMSENERATHPQLQLVPHKYWSNYTLFANHSNPWIINLMKTGTNLTQELAKINVNKLPEQQKNCTWLAIVFSHPELSDDSLRELANQFSISGELQFKTAISAGRIKLLNMAVDEHLRPDRVIGFWEHVTTLFNDPTDKLQDVLLEGNFSVFQDAASRGDLAIFMRLAELAAVSHININYVNEFAFYAIFRTAVQNGHLKIVGFLLELDDTKVKDMLEFADTYSAYSLAKGKDHQPVVALLDEYALLHNVTFKNRISVSRAVSNCGIFSIQSREEQSGSYVVASGLIN